MGSNTSNLGLYKPDPTTDGNNTFNITTMLNDNWDRIDYAAKRYYVDSASSTDAYAVSIAGITDYTQLAGIPLFIKVNTANTTSANLNVNNLGAKSIVRGVNTSLLTGDILANQIIEVVFDGTNFQLKSQGADVSQASKTETLTNKTINNSTINSSNGVVINDADGIKATHTDNSNSVLSDDGLIRTITLPTYTYNSTGVPNLETFTSKTIAGLQLDGWTFAGYFAISSGRLLVGSTSTVGESVANVSKYITANNASFSFTYSNTTDSNARYYFVLDGVSTELSRTTTTTTYSATLSKGWHSFQWISTYPLGLNQTIPSALYMYIDDIMFEQNPVAGSVSGSTAVTKNYNYMVKSGTGTSGSTVVYRSDDAVPEVIVQLPDEFKGKNFEVNVFPSNIPAISDYSIKAIYTNVISKDTVNATFKVKAYCSGIIYGYHTTYGFYTITARRGCGFTYIATY